MPAKMLRKGSNNVLNQQIGNPLRDALTMPKPSACSVCLTRDSWLIQIARMAWYACVKSNSPAHEEIFLATGFSPYLDIREIDEVAFYLHSNDIADYIANLQTDWTLRRDKVFAGIGLPLLRLIPAIYPKHQLGASDQKRKENSLTAGASQLLTRFDSGAQNMLCDRALFEYIDKWISEVVGEAYSDEIAINDDGLFISSLTKLFDNGPLRIEAHISSEIGYDVGKSVNTFILEVDVPHFHYHIYPSTFTAEQLERAIFVENVGWSE